MENAGGKTVLSAAHEATTDSENPGYSQLVTRIRAGDTVAMEKLYEDLLPALRRRIFYSLGPQDTNDAVNDTFYTAFALIKSGAVREPERLRSYIWGIARIHILGYIQSSMVRRGRESGLGMAGTVADCQPSPEETVQVSESHAVAREAMRGLLANHREVLMRFYVTGQSPEEICRDLSLTATQFRLMKNRAKKRFGQLGKRILSRKRPGRSLWPAASLHAASPLCAGNIS
jgi:RNA polymerase sigma factor (sigma-70 family)